MRLLLIGLLMLLIPSLATADELSIFAASSLTEALKLTVQAYQSIHPEDKILLHFAGSQTLATQIEQGAPADLFISANTAVMSRLNRAQLLENPQTLLRNSLIIALCSDLQPRPMAINDLARPGLLLAVGNPRVPVGRYTQNLFNALANDPQYGTRLVRRIKQNIVSQENRDKAIIAKLLLGEIDAGIVYRTDLTAPGARKLRAVELPAAHNPQAEYPLAKVRGAQAATDIFINFLFSAQAREIFIRQGFQCAERG
ncbi:MAG: molybdate ABC transporter substrate-binding protein [Geopsychrobacter sp.]|nr:molybdate ABC transporter substrate-binding protein [Geopsychrobacter sp.]